MTRDEVITEHRRLSECWPKCGHPDWGVLHAKRADALSTDDSLALTDDELAGDSLGMMCETIQETN